MGRRVEPVRPLGNSGARRLSVRRRGSRAKRRVWNRRSHVPAWRRAGVSCRPPMSRRRLLLITGAGASTGFGKTEPLPMMPGWNDRLCDELDARGPGLADAAHLARGMDGEAFEQALGLVLDWQQAQPLAARFRGLACGRPNDITTHVDQFLQNTETHLRTLGEAVDTTLWTLFGDDRVDFDQAREAYDRVLREFTDIETSVVVATTNYDHMAENALHMLGRNPNLGFTGTLGNRTL